MKKYFILILAIIFGGCQSGVKNIVHKRHTKFGISPILDDDWRQRGFRGADLFFENIKDGASISITAQCEKLLDSPLEALTAQLLAGLKVNYLSQNPYNISNREGLRSEVDAELDGVHTNMIIIVLRKNRCVYDAILSGAKNEKIIADFDNLLKTFWAEADL